MSSSYSMKQSSSTRRVRCVVLSHWLPRCNVESDLPNSLLFNNGVGLFHSGAIKIDVVKVAPSGFVYWW